MQEFTDKDAKSIASWVTCLRVCAQSNTFDSLDQCCIIGFFSAPEVAFNDNGNAIGRYIWQTTSVMKTYSVDAITTCLFWSWSNQNKMPENVISILTYNSLAIFSRLIPPIFVSQRQVLTSFASESCLGNLNWSSTKHLGWIRCTVCMDSWISTKQ